MTEETPHLDHTAPKKKSLWQRWLDWNGSFFVVSLLFHILLIVIATLLVVQVINYKPKLKFTAAPPIAAHPEEYHVKHSKKMASDAPAVSKRITTTALNAQITLPAVDITTSTGPDVMASVMSGLGASGLGAGAGAGGGIASMPMEGMTAFGFKGAGKQSLVGNFYDLKQTPGRQPSALAKIDEGLGGGYRNKANTAQIAIFKDFFRNWDENVFSRYYKARDQMNAVQIWVPGRPSPEGPKAFGVEKEVPVGSHWLVLYKGTVTAPKDGTFRFLGMADDVLAVRFNGETVFGTQWDGGWARELFGDSYKTQEDIGFPYGNWFKVEGGKTYPIEVLISEVPGGMFGVQLMIEDQNPPKPYPHRTSPGFEKYRAYPVFQVRRGMPIPPYVPNGELDGPWQCNPETAPEPIVFLAK